MIIDLCSGAGGWTEALRLAGLSVSFAVEHDHSIASTYAANHGNHVVVADINTLPPQTITGRIEGIVAGPPCQPFSDAGYNEGVGDERNAIPGVLNWIQHHRPEWFIIENVPGLLSRHRKYLRSQVIEPLVKAGYYVDLTILDAADFGVPQQRKRLFIAGRLDGRMWFWPTPSNERRGWGEVLLPLLEQREPDADSIPDYAGGAAIPMLSMTRSGGQRGQGLIYRLSGEPAYTVTTTWHGITGGGSAPWVRAPFGCYQLRRRVPEAATLQGFRPDYQFASVVEIGNAVPPPLGAAVIKEVAQ